jgi:hypothetical protein
MPTSRSPWFCALVLIAGACGSAQPSDAKQAEAARPDSPFVTVTAPAPIPAAPAESDAVRQEIRGVRTSLKVDDCTLVSVDEESASSEQRCPGTAGYTLMALDGDARMSITVKDPAGREHPLDFWTTITGGFSSLGEEAEWRVRGDGAAAVPIALIVTLRANEHPDDPERVTPYRVIAKITPTEACVTHRLSGATPDAEARRLADASAGQPCHRSYSEP